MTYNCPSCQTTVTVTPKQECPNCGWRFGATPKFTIPRPDSRPKLPINCEIAIAVDRTGSSGEFATGIRQSIPIVLQTVESMAKGLRVWIQTHGDLDCGQRPILLTDGGKASEAINDLETIVFEGGGDPPEHHLDAIERLMNLVPWTSDPKKARGALMAMLTADSKPARSGITPTQLGKEIRARGLLLYLVCEPTPQLHELSQAAAGLMFQITNAPDVTDLQRIASQLAASVVQTMASGGTVPLSQPFVSK